MLIQKLLPYEALFYPTEIYEQSNRWKKFSSIYLTLQAHWKELGALQSYPHHTLRIADLVLYLYYNAKANRAGLDWKQSILNTSSRETLFSPSSLNRFVWAFLQSVDGSCFLCKFHPIVFSLLPAFQFWTVTSNSNCKKSDDMLEDRTASASIHYTVPDKPQCWIGHLVLKYTLHLQVVLQGGACPLWS